MAGIDQVFIGFALSLLLGLVWHGIRRIKNDGAVAKHEFQLVLEAFAKEVLLGISSPVKIADLAGGEADQRIAMAQCVVEEREGMLLGEGGQPQRELGQINSHVVPVHAIKTALGDDPAGMEQFIFVRWNRRQGVGTAPGVEQMLAQLTADFDQERARTHGGIADLKIKNLLRRGLGTELLEYGSKGGLDDGAGERPRRIV